MTTRLPAHLRHPFSVAGRPDPHPAYRWLRENDPVHFDPLSRSWLVTSHAGCAAALTDARFSASLGQRERRRDDPLPASMLTTDPPAHARLRGPGALLLGPAALRTHESAIATAVEQMLSNLAADSTVDVATDIGEPFATEVFLRLLSMPGQRRAEFADLARRMSVNLDPLAGPAAAAGRAAAQEFCELMDAHVEALTAAGVDAPITRLAADPRISRAETLGILTLVVVGGYLPLADVVGHAVYHLAPEVLDGLPRSGNGPVRESGAAGRLVDELMRLATPIPFAARVTTEPVELPGGILPAGARVLLVIAAANRDPAVFPRPDDVDPGRTPNPHLAFGAGPHLCLGAPLVRWAGGRLLGELAARFPRRRTTGAAGWDPALVPRRPRGQRVLLHG
jgi:cytochrome P450